MTDKLSEVAQAIALSVTDTKDADWEGAEEALKEDWLGPAKAAIQAHEKALEAEGLVIVPREPTKKMIKAYKRAMESQRVPTQVYGNCGPSLKCVYRWQAMLAALEGK